MAIQQSGIQFVAKDLGSFLNALSAAARGVGQFVSSAQKSAGSLNLLSGHFKNFGQDLAYVARHLLLDAFRAIGDGIKDFVGAGLSQVALYDRMTGSLTALTAKELLAAGSVNTFADGMKAAVPHVQENIKWIEKLALISTFESDEILSVQQYAQSVGIATKEAKLMTFALTAWGTVTKKQPHELLNVSNALTDMFTKGRVQAEEMRQLTRNNIPAWDYLAKAVGVTTDELREMVSDGLVPADVGIKAIVEGMARDYGPAMKEFTFSIAGIVSSFQDLSKISLRELFMPVVETALPAMTRLVSILSQPEFREKVQMLGTQIAMVASEVINFGEAMFASGDPIEFVALKIDNVLPGFLSFVRQLEELGATIGQIVSKAFGWGESIGKSLAEGLLSAASHVVSALQKIADAINGFLGEGDTGSWKDKIGGAIGTHPDVPMPGGIPGETGGPALPEGDIGIDEGILGPITDALDQLNQEAAEARTHWDNLRTAFEEARAKALEVSAAIGPLNPIVAGLGLAFGSVLATGAASAAINLLKVLSPIGLLTGGMTLLYTAWTENWGGIQEHAAATIPLIEEQIGKIPGIMQGIGDSVNNDVLPALEKLASWFSGPGLEGINNFATEAGPGIEHFVELVGDRFGELIDLGDKVVSWFATNWPNLGKHMGQVANIVGQASDVMVGKFSVLGASITVAGFAFDIFATVTQAAMQLAAGDVDGLAKTVEDAMNRVGQALGLSAQDMSNWRASIADAAIGAMMIFLDFQQGIANVVAAVIGFITTMRTSIASTVAGMVAEVIGFFTNLKSQAVQLVADMVAGVSGKIAEFSAIMSSISGFVDGAVAALGRLVSAAYDAAAALASIVIPAPLLGHSPSPFETSLVGIGAALIALRRAADLVNPAFAQLEGVTADIQETLEDLAEDAAKLIHDLEMTFLESKVGGFEQMRSNARIVTNLYQSVLEAQKDSIDAERELQDIIAKGAEERAQAEKKLADAIAAGNTEKIEAARKELAAVEALYQTKQEAAAAEIQAAQEAAERQARLQDRVDKQLDIERDAFMQRFEGDPEGATEMFNLRSRQIKDLAALDEQIESTKDERLKELLIKERNFMHYQHMAELDLFNKEAQHRTNKIKEQVKEIAVAWADAWTDLTLSGDFVGPIKELYDLIVKLSALQLPEWLTPGSPTPLEHALVGIGDAVRHLSATELPRLRYELETGLARPPATASQIAGATSTSYTYAPQFNLGVNTNNSPAAVIQSYALMRSLYA